MSLEISSPAYTQLGEGTEQKMKRTGLEWLCHEPEKGRANSDDRQANRPDQSRVRDLGACRSVAASPATTGQRPGDDFETPTSPEERLTLLDLVAGVQDAAESDAEVTSTLRHMFETGRVRLDSLSVQEHPCGA